MATKGEQKKRYRLLLEIPEEEKPVWLKARAAALGQGKKIGKFIIEAIREKLAVLDAAEKGKKR